MADTKKKLTSGKIFMARVEIATKKGKESLLDLAATTIRNSHSERTYFERELPKSQTALNMRATYATMNAYTGKELSTDQRLILIKQRYQKAGYGDFDKDFAKAYPQEYGKEKTHTHALNMPLNRRQTQRY